MSATRQRKPAASPQQSPQSPAGLLTPSSRAYDFNTMDSRATASSQPSTVNVISTPIGVYGWRKYCLYATVLVVLALCIINIGLLVWIANVLEMDGGHFGPLYVKSDKLQVKGRAEFTDGLVVDKLSGFDAAQLLVESNVEVRLRAVDAGANTASDLSLAAGGTLLTTPSFRAVPDDDPTSQPYLEAAANTLTLRANDVHVASASGMNVDGSLQANTIVNAVGGTGTGLTLESAGQDLTLLAGDDVAVTSTNGDVTVQALLDVQLTAGNDLVLEAQNQLRVTGLPVPAAETNEAVFQLCMCAADQRLYRVAATSTCDQGAAAVGC